MISFSKPFLRYGRISVQLPGKNIIFRRNNYNVKFEKIDRENYQTKKYKKRTPDILAVVTLGVPLTCFVLALWQIDRKRWKDKLVEDMKLRTRIPAIELPEDLSERRFLEYRRFKVRGTFDHSREIYLGPRSLIKNNEFDKTITSLFPLGSPQKPNIGLCVITPFKLADRDLTILVNRGWVPNDLKDPEMRTEGQIQDEVELEGILRLKEDKPRYSPAEFHIGRNFRYRDLAAMAEVTNSSFIFLDATEESTVPGGPLGGQTQVKLKNDHMEYILTWLSIGLYTTYMWHRRFIRKLN